MRVMLLLNELNMNQGFRAMTPVLGHCSREAGRTQLNFGKVEVASLITEGSGPVLEQASWMWKKGRKIPTVQQDQESRRSPTVGFTGGGNSHGSGPADIPRVGRFSLGLGRLHSRVKRNLPQHTQMCRLYHCSNARTVFKSRR
jgi:hypothetical protein